MNYTDPWGNLSGAETALGGALLIFPEVALGIAIVAGIGVAAWSLWQIWELSEALENADTNPEEVPDAAKTQGKECSQGEKSKSKIDRNKAAKERSDYWKNEAERNPDKYSPEDLERMQKGKPPIGPDGKPVELHHQDGTPSGPKEPMTRTDHRTGDNYLKNHPWLKR